MKAAVIVILCLLLSINDTMAQTVKASLSYNEFYSPKDGQFLEAYINIFGESLSWVKADNKYKSEVELTVMFKQGSNIIAFSKDIIKSYAKDSLEMKNAFMHTNRYVLKNGNYNIDIKIDDLNDTIDGIFSSSEFTIINPIDSVYSSSLEVFSNISKAKEASSRTKNGYDITPNVYRFLGEQDTVLQFYSEIYNTKKVLGDGEGFLVTYYLIDNSLLKEVHNYKINKRKKASNVVVMFGALNIKELASGSYTLVMEVRDRNFKLLSTKDYFFRRYNPNIKFEIEEIEDVNIAETFVENIHGQDTLARIIRTFRPVSSVNEKMLAETVMRDSNEYIMQQFILNFWEMRNKQDPYGAFKKHMERIRECDKLYATRIKSGYETDRGRVFMQYGKANSIAVEYNDPAAYPYEIWHYYQAKGQRNVKFIFYNTDLISNEFELLHSDASGERNDYQWRLHLRRDQGFKSIDDRGNGQDQWGSQYNNLYENPR